MLAFLFKLARFIFLVLLVRYLIHWLFYRGRSAIPHPQSEVGPPTVVGETRRDPVCGTFVSTELSLKALVGGQEQHFCSGECRDRWMADYGLRIGEGAKSPVHNP